MRAALEVGGSRMKLKILVGAGDRVMGLTLPFAVIGLIINIIRPDLFHMGLGAPGLIVGIVMMAVGVPLWLVSVAQILIHVPRRELITRGPFALILHPIYTSVALLVLPGLGLALDTWLGPAVGVILYISSRLFAGSEEKMLASIFPKEYPAYRARVLLPWL
jgi:protein-S-isoprenylcysteine O-methyltransferase Ste14